MGMLRTLDAANIALDAVHLHYAASPDQAIFADELRRLAVRHSGFGFKFGATGTGPIPPELALTTRRVDALFLDCGVETPGDGTRPLLELAEEAGLSPKHGCRMGICHTCVVRLNSGSVLDLRDGQIQSDEGDFVQICVSAPCGDVSLEL